MAEPPTERPCASTIGNTQTGGAEASNPQAATETASQLVSQLSQAEISNLVTLAAQSYPGVMTMLNDAVIAMREREGSRIVTFDSYPGSVWREISHAYKTLRGAAMYEQSFKVVSSVVDSVEQIANQSGPNASPQTRLNGLSVLRKIGKTVCLSGGDIIGWEVRKSYEVSSALVDGMRNIIQSMEADEIDFIRDQTGPKPLYPKLLELHRLAKNYRILQGLEEAIAMLGGEEEGEEDGEEDDEEDDEEDSEEDGEEEGEEMILAMMSMEMGKMEGKEEGEEDGEEDSEEMVMARMSMEMGKMEVEENAKRAAKRAAKMKAKRKAKKKAKRTAKKKAKRR